MMNFFQAQKLGLKKIKFSKGKSLFVIIPIALMFAIIVVAASENRGEFLIERRGSRRRRVR